MLWKNIQLTSFKEEEVFDCLFISLVAGLVVARFMYVVLHFDDFGFDILRFILINGYPGLSLFGGILGFFLSAYIYSVIQKIKFFDLMDYMVPPLILALAIGKVGSFFAGIEVGAVTDFVVSIKYANHDGMRHLTAFYESLVLFLGAFVSYRLMFQVRKGDVISKGFLLPYFVWHVSLVYVAFDMLRAEHTMVSGYSLFFVVPLAILLTTTVYFIYYFRNLLFSRFFGKK